jgi:hypothetical protein
MVKLLKEDVAERVGHVRNSETLGFATAAGNQNQNGDEENEHNYSFRVYSTAGAEVLRPFVLYSLPCITK